MTLMDRRLDDIVSGLAHQGGCGCSRCRHARVRRSARRFEAGFTPTAADPSVGTPRGTIALPEWRGWGSGVALYDLLRVASRLDVLLAGRGTAQPAPAQLDQAWREATGRGTARASAMPANFRSYFLRVPRLYRISARGGAGGSSGALDIGMTQTGCPGFRVMAHFIPDAPRSALARWSGGGRGLGRLLQARGAVRRDARTGLLVLPSDFRKYQVHLGLLTREAMWRGGQWDVRYIHAFESVLQRHELPAATYASIQRRREAEG